MIIDIVLFYAIGRGGLETVITKVSNKLIELGHRVRVFQAYQPEFIEWEYTMKEIYYYSEDIQKEELIKNVYYYSINYRKLVQDIGRPDIVLATHEPIVSYLCYLALNNNPLNRIPIVSWIHGIADVYGHRELLSFSDAHLGISSVVSENLSKSLDAEYIYKVGNPVETNNINVVKRPSDELVLLSLGRLDKDKRIDVLFKVLSKVNGKWKLKLFGDGAKRKILELLARSLKINNNIEWYGWQSDPWSLIDEASVTIITSISESFSMGTAESLARGIPVISTKCGGPEDMIKNNVNGWLFNINDIEGAAGILNKIQSGEYILPSSDVCKKSINIFSEEVVIDNIEKVLVKVRKMYDKY